MALSIRLVVIFSFLCWLSLVSAAEEPVRLRLLSYNIHHGLGVDDKLDLQRIAKVIQSVQPDIVALQEVDQNVQRSGVVDQAAELGRLTEMVSLFGGNIDLQGGRYGNAVLTRFVVVEQINLKLPNVRNGEQRGVMKVMLRIPGRQSLLTVLATHFDHRRDEEERVLSAKYVNSLVETTDSAVFMGDLNDVIGSQSIKLLDEVWQRVNREPLPTIPVNEPKRQIDYISLYPLGSGNTVEAKVLKEAVASDHRPLFAVVELK